MSGTPTIALRYPYVICIFVFIFDSNKGLQLTVTTQFQVDGAKYGV